MAMSPIEKTCTKCNQTFSAVPKRNLLGFPKITCPNPSCKAVYKYPLTNGYRTAMWVLFALMVGAVALTLMNGGIPRIGIIGILVIVTLVQDYKLRKQLAAEGGAPADKAALTGT